MNGTEKQIAWATEIREKKLGAIKSNARNTSGNDRHLSELVNYAAGEIARAAYPEKSDVPKKRELRDRLESTDIAALRAYVVSEMEAVTDAGWWIENRAKDVIAPIVNEYLSKIH